jgi:hypothetical protein
MKKTNNFIKYLIGLITVIIMRLVPHPPNVEPVMATMMPFSKKWGWLGGSLFSILAILSYDLITGTIGVWSLMTMGAYTLVGGLSGIYFKNRENTIKNYLVFSIIGTLLYDAITGIGTGMLFFDQSFMVTFLGQIPFTLYHLAGNIFLSATVSPLLYKWVIKNPKLETRYVLGKVFPKFS